MERNAKLITKKFYQYLLPSVLMIFAMQFGSLLDGIIIGNTIGSDALSASALVTPVLYIIQIPGFALSVGGAIAVGNLLGKRNLDQANKVFSACIIFGTAASALFAVMGPFVSRPLARLFAGTLEEYSYQYILVYMVTDPVVMLAMIVAAFIAVDNNPKLSSAFYIVSNAVKIGTEVLFIKVFKLEMYGAALSTAVGYLFGLVTVIFYIRSKKRMLKFTWRIKGVGKEMKVALKASLSNALTLLLMATQTLIINVVLSRMITDELDLIIFGLVSNLVFVFDLFSGGILGMIPTLCGVLYGEKDTYSLKSVVKRIYFINIGVSAVITAIILAWPHGYASLFGYSGTGEGLERASFIIRIYVLSAIPLEINKFSTNYYPSIEKTMPSLLTVLLREGALVLPLTLVLMKAEGLFGFSLARVITEYATVLIVYGVILIYNLKKKKYRGIFMFDKADRNAFDITVESKVENAPKVSREVVDFALGHDVDNKSAQLLGVACEEMVSNIALYGYKKQKSSYVDVNVKVSDNDILLRIRDDGMPFDPTKYECEQNEEYRTGGIALITGLADELNYMRVLNLNNTVFKINRGEK